MGSGREKMGYSWMGFALIMVFLHWLTEYSRRLITDLTASGDAYFLVIACGLEAARIRNSQCGLKVSRDGGLANTTLFHL